MNIDKNDEKNSLMKLLKIIECNTNNLRIKQKLKNIEMRIDSRSSKNNSSKWI